MRSLLPLLVFLLSSQLSFGRVEIAPCKNNFSPEQQIELGQKAVQQVYAEMPVLPDSSPVTKYAQQLGAKLVAQAPGQKWPYNFHVANVAEINAFALPGGAIFVNLGTIQAAANEAQLAGVMAHEISHVVLQHSVCNAAKQQKVGLIAGLGQIAAGVLLGGAAGTLAQQGIGLTAGLGFLKMSRGAEKEAGRGNTVRRRLRSARDVAVLRDHTGQVRRGRGAIYERPPESGRSNRICR
jgi:predicted Zn-dependent protease